MDEQQEGLLQESWQAHDHRSGVAKVYAASKQKAVLGVQVAAVWGVIIVLFGALDFAEVFAVAPWIWDVVGGAGVLLLAALGLSRNPGPMLAAVAIVLGDLSVLSYHFPVLLDGGTPTDQAATGLRLAIAPIAMFFVLQGYFGCLSIQAFKNGFSPGADWRTRMNPRMVQLVVIGSCVVALMLGVGSWLGAIAGGFAETNVSWATRFVLRKPVKMKVGTMTNVEGAKTDGQKEGFLAEFTFINKKPDEGPSGPIKYPDTAKPITSVKGLDEFTRASVEEAYEFAAETDDAGCLMEGHGRQDRCRDDRCRYWAKVFSRACLAKAKKSPHFCDGVPDPTDPKSGTSWAEKLCAGRNFETCREMLFTQQGHCHPPEGEDATPPEARGGQQAAAAPAR